MTAAKKRQGPPAPRRNDGGNKQPLIQLHGLHLGKDDSQDDVVSLEEVWGEKS